MPQQKRKQKGDDPPRLTRAAVQFALRHVVRYGDTDLLPLPFEFGAIRFKWNDVFLPWFLQQDVGTWKTRPFRRIMTPKAYGGFRMATQLDPLDSLFYTALVYMLGPAIEAARLPISDGVAIAHRFRRNAKGSMWTEGGTWGDFQRRSRALAESPDVRVVLKADIADFYQRIYHHPLENRLKATGVRAAYVRALLRLLSECNGNVSYGIPIGQAASRLLAELVLDDIDRALIGEGFTHCRWIDDFRIFCSTDREANKALAFLTKALSENHGLGLQQSKTVFLTDSNFQLELEQAETIAIQVNRDTRSIALPKFLGPEPQEDGDDDEFDDDNDDDPDDDAKDGWGEDGGEDDWDFDDLPKVSLAPTSFEYLPAEIRALVDRFDAGKIVMQLLARYSRGFGVRAPDPGLLRVLIAKLIQERDVTASDAVVANLGNIGPILPDAIRYLNAIRGKLTRQRRIEIGDECSLLLQDTHLGDLEFSIMWVLSLFADSTAFDHENRLPQFYNDYQVQAARRKSILAIGNSKNDGWFRVHRNEFASLAPWERRAFLFGARCMEKDERKHWYDSVKKGFDTLDTAIVAYASRERAKRGVKTPR